MKFLTAALIAVSMLLAVGCQSPSVNEKDVFGNVQVNGSYWMDVTQVYKEEGIEETDSWTQVLPIVQVGDEITFIGFPAESTVDAFELVGERNAPSAIFGYTLRSVCEAGGGGNLDGIAAKLDCWIDFWNDEAGEFQDPYPYSYDYDLSNILLFTSPNYPGEASATASSVSDDPDRMVMSIPRKSYLKKSMEKRGLDTKYPKVYTRL